MSEFKNSQRRFYKATYAPTQLNQSGEDKKQQAKKTRCFEKFSFIQSLAIRPAEITDLQDLIKSSPSEQAEQLRQVLKIVEDIAGESSPSTLLRHVHRFTKVDGQALIQFGKLLAKDRSLQSKKVEASLEQIRKHYIAALELDPTLVAKTPQPAKEAATPIFIGAPVSKIPNSNKITQPQEADAERDLAREVRPTIGAADRITPLAGEHGVRTGQFLRILPPLENAIEWAGINDKGLFDSLHSLAQKFAPNAVTRYSNIGPALLVEGFLDIIKNWAGITINLVDAFEERMKIEPVGRLHLERLEMTPVGVERGELLYSVPLAPKETVNITHKEWATRSEEFENIVQDYFEGYSEEGVAEKNDIAMSTESQSKRSNAINLNASVSGGYMGTTISTSFGYNTTSDDQQAKKDSRNHSIETTRKASARSKKEHKVSFKVSSVAGTEDLAVRTITNPSDTKVMRVDYFSMMRKWRVDLHRYGLRMTYDIVIPNPGADLMRKIEELRALDALIEQPFEFPLKVTAITAMVEDNSLGIPSWHDLAALYHATVESPPAKLPPEMVYHKEWLFQDTKNRQFDSLEFDVDPNYTVETAKLRVMCGGLDASNPHFHLTSLKDSLQSKSDPEVDPAGRLTEYWSDNLESLVGKSGNLSVTWGAYGYKYGSVNVTLALKLRDEAFKEWQFKAWSAMREAAQETYYQNRQTYKERREQLAAELNAFDTLTLRRMEQEEIMKGVLRWLFGPDFELFPADIEGLIDLEGDLNWQNVWQDIYLISTGKKEPMSRDRNVLNPNWLTNQSWKRVMEFGEFIKFLHNAIEWENMLYFLYPYFWDSAHNWDKKRFLDHPDPLHRMFLRAGCARVVLTIRPGFEESFSRMVETGSLNGTLPGEHPYVPIAQEIQNYAKTNYPGIPPANPAENARPLLYPKQQQAWDEMQVLVKLLDYYSKQYSGNYPKALADLKEADLKEVGSVHPVIKTQDPWGNDYVYDYPGSYGDYDLISYGANGQPGGTDENADITSWADSDLIGQWYEYTPTSALDISINTEPADMG